jgi:hypothetical protein
VDLGQKSAAVNSVHQAGMLAVLISSGRASLGTRKGNEYAQYFVNYWVKSFNQSHHDGQKKYSDVSAGCLWQDNQFGVLHLR